MAAALQKVQAALGVGGVKPTVGTKLETGVKLKETNVTQADVDLDAIVSSGKHVIIGVPGAFSATCHSQVPGYLENWSSLSSKGVKGVYVVAVNDVFVTKAWREQLGGAKNDNVHFLADDGGAFTAAIGMSFDAAAFFGNNRSHRYAMLVEDGIVKAFEQEPADTDSTVTRAETFMAKL